MKRRSFGGRRTTGRIPCVYKRTRRRGLRRTRRSENESGHVRAVRSVDIRRTRALRTSAGRPPPLRARGTQASARAPRGEARCPRGDGPHSRLREQRGQMRHKRRQRRTLPLIGQSSPWVPARVLEVSRAAPCSPSPPRATVGGRAQRTARSQRLFAGAFDRRLHGLDQMFRGLDRTPRGLDRHRGAAGDAGRSQQDPGHGQHQRPLDGRSARRLRGHAQHRAAALRLAARRRQSPRRRQHDVHRPLADEPDQALTPAQCVAL